MKKMYLVLAVLAVVMTDSLYARSESREKKLALEKELLVTSLRLSKAAQDGRREKRCGCNNGVRPQQGPRRSEAAATKSRAKAERKAEKQKKEAKKERRQAKA
jgi:hypothetical protein